MLHVLETLAEWSVLKWPTLNIARAYFVTGVGKDSGLVVCAILR